MKLPTEEEYTWCHRQKEDFDTQQALKEVEEEMGKNTEEAEEEGKEGEEEGEQEEPAGEGDTEGVENKPRKIRARPTERRIDYLAINEARANICTAAEVMPTGWTPWQTDHKTTRITGVGPKVLRREEKKKWQRPTYQTKNMEDIKVAKVHKQVRGWTRVGRTAKEKLEKLVQRVQSSHEGRSRAKATMESTTTSATKK